MFKAMLKKNFIPIIIVALALVVGISLFFNNSSVYKKKTIVNTNQIKEDTTTTSDGKGCVERFNSLQFSVNQDRDLDEDGYFTFTISSSTGSENYKKVLKESGYSNSITYRYAVKRVEMDSKGKITKVISTEDSGTITISNSKYTSSKQTKKLSTKYHYIVEISTTAWVRDKKATGDTSNQTSPDPGYFTCPAGKVTGTFKFDAVKMSGESKYKLTTTKFYVEGSTESGADKHLTPAGQGVDDPVNNYEVNDSCKLPNNAQANKYLLKDTDVYPGTKAVSATFRKYLSEFEAAPASHKKNAALSSGDKVDTNFELQCDYKLDVEDVKSVAEGIKYAYTSKGLKYYKYDASNTHYFKASKTTQHYVKPYEYHTAAGKIDENKDNYCTRTCTEIVKVEYGSPAYVQAGLCFQYRMKVSSIVQCEYDKSHMRKPSREYQLCQPEAYCVHRSYTAIGKGSLTQAGPNEDYEACVNKCDGGKYTKDCSNACYNIVYGAANDKNLALYSNTRPTNTGSSAHGFFTYFQYNNGYIGFTSGYTGEVPVGSAIGYSHAYVTGMSMKGYVVKFVDSAVTYGMIDGIPRANYGGAYCQESCGWIRGAGCSGSASDWYFEGDTDNPNYGRNVANADYDANMKKYDAALTECKAKATCVTSTATYTIMTKFVDASEEKLKVTEAVFPFSSNKKTETKSPASSCNLSMKDRSPVISFGGCYANSNADRWYQGEMTFPGSYLDYKHNSVNVNPSKDGTDILLPGRMCINENQGNTNAAWAKKFDDLLGRLNKNSNYTATASQINSYWDGSFKGNAGGYSKESKNTVNGYNIYGIIDNFGYFKWNFRISCFYALYDEGGCNKDEIACSDCKNKKVCVKADEAKNNSLCNNTCPPDDNYTVRSFNASDPLVTNTNSNRENADVQYKEEAITGFNWTSQAKLEYMGNGYSNDPEALAQDIINNQNTIFDDSVNKPNYVVYLDSKTIKAIKRYNRDVEGYKTFNDKDATNPNRVNQVGVKFYYSSFLHNTSIFGSKYNKIPRIDSRLYQCNYFVNDDCRLLAGGGE